MKKEKQKTLLQPALVASALSDETVPPPPPRNKLGAGINLSKDEVTNDRSESSESSESSDSETNIASSPTDSVESKQREVNRIKRIFEKYKYTHKLQKTLNKTNPSTGNTLNQLYNNTLSWMKAHHYYDNSWLPWRDSAYQEAEKIKIHLSKPFSPAHYKNKKSKSQRQSFVNSLQTILQNLYEYLKTVHKTSNSGGIKIIWKLLEEAKKTSSNGNGSKTLFFKDAHIIFNLIQDEAIQRTSFRSALHRKWHNYRFGDLGFFALKKGRDNKINGLYNMLAKTNLFAASSDSSGSVNTLKDLNDHLENLLPSSDNEENYTLHS